MKRKTEAKTAKKLRFAVVGLGHIAQAAFLPAFKKKSLPAELTALVSGDDKKLRKVGKQYGVELTCNYSDYRELLASKTIDAVYIALPNTMHHEYAKAALESGVHVLCEKPLCTSSDDCRDLIETAEKTGTKLMTAYRLHLDPTNLKAIELIKKKRIGEPVYFTSQFSYQIKKENIRLEDELAGGALYDIGIYCINAARYIFRAEPTAVFGRLIKGQDKRFEEVDGTVCAQLFFSDGRVASFIASFASFEKSQFEVVGTKGSIKLDPAYEYTTGLSLTLETGAGKKTIKHKQHDQFGAQIVHFAEAVNNGRKLETDAREGLADIRIIEAIIRSSETGRLVELEDFSTDYPTGSLAKALEPEEHERLVNAESASR